MTRSRRVVGAVGPAILLSLALMVGFSGQVRRPGWLIVDGERPWVDEGSRPGPRAIGNDLTGLILPRFLWQSDQWRRFHRIPLWDPRGFAGRPNAGNPQAGLWYPPAWLAWMWGHTAAPGWLTIAHLFSAGLGAFALARSTGLGRTAATTSGAVLMLNPYGIAQVLEGHLPHVWSASWYPWALLGALHVRRGRRSGWVLLPGSLALSLMAGHPQEGVYLILALAGWAAFDLCRSLALRWRRSVSGTQKQGELRYQIDKTVHYSKNLNIVFNRISIRLSTAIVLAIGLSGVDWAPVLAARPWVAGPLGGEGGGAGGPYHLWPSNLMQLLSPRALGGPSDYFGRGTYWETMLSFGWAPLVLLLVGVSRYPGRSRVIGWSTLLGLGLLHAFGESGGLAAVVGKLPGMEAVRVPSRSLFLSAVAAAMLAGMGVDVMARGLSRRASRRYGMAVILIGLMVASGMAANRFTEARHDSPPISLIDRWMLACDRLSGDGLWLASVAATGASLFVASRWPGAGGRASAAIGLSAIGELAASAAIVLPICPPERFLEPDGASEVIARTRPAGAPFRVRARDTFYPDLLAWRDAVEKTNLNDLFQIRHAAEIYRLLYPIFKEPGPRIGPDLEPASAHAALDRLGVARVITDRPVRLEIGPRVASGVRDGTPFEVIANPGAMPRAYVVPRAEVVPEGVTMDKLVRVDPRAAVLMTSDPMAGVDGPRQPFTQADYESTGPDRIIVRAIVDDPGFLVIVDSWMPGWSATLDGRPVPVLRGDHAFRVVRLPGPGMHRVVMRYRAPGLIIGTCLSVISGAVMIVLALAPRRRMPGKSRECPAGESQGTEYNQICRLT